MSTPITPPDGPWGRTWLLAVAIAGAVLGGWELRLRARGFEPTVQDGPLLWSATRAQVPEDDPDAVVLVGASRLQLSVDLDTFEAETDRRPFMLAIDGSRAQPVLDELAHRSRYAGTVLYSLAPAACRAAPDPLRGRQADWVRFHRTASAFVPVEAGLRAAVDVRLRLRLAETRPRERLRQGLRAMTPRPQYVLMDAERARRADFARIDPRALEAEMVRRLRAEGGPRSSVAGAVVAHARLLDAAAAELARRGGDLVVLRMPGQGEHERFVDESCPRVAFWDELVARTRAVTIHADDEPELSRFAFPDGSHLDRRDRPAFTRALVEVLRRHLPARFE